MMPRHIWEGYENWNYVFLRREARRSGGKVLESERSREGGGTGKDEKELKGENYASKSWD